MLGVGNGPPADQQLRGPRHQVQGHGHHDDAQVGRGGQPPRDAGLVLTAQVGLPDWSKSMRPVSEWARFGTRT